MATRQDPGPNVLSDTELLAAITRDLRAIYSDVIREPLPDRLAATLKRLEFHSGVSDRLNIARAQVSVGAWAVEKRNVERMSTISDVSRALADPAMRARVDGLIEQFRTRGVRMNALNIIAALTDAGLQPDAANILAETVLARIGQRVAPLDALPPQLGRRYVAPSG